MQIRLISVFALIFSALVLSTSVFSAPQPETLIAAGVGVQTVQANNIFICQPTTYGFKVLPVNNGTACVDNSTCTITTAVYLYCKPSNDSVGVGCAGTPQSIVDAVRGMIFPKVQSGMVPPNPPYLWEENLNFSDMFIPLNSVNCRGYIYNTSVSLQNKSGVPWGTLTFAGEAKFSPKGDYPKDANGKPTGWGLISGTISDYQDFNFTPIFQVSPLFSLAEDKTIKMQGVSTVESTGTGSVIHSGKMTVSVNATLIAKEGQLIAPIDGVEKQITVMPHDLNTITDTNVQVAKLDVTLGKAVYVTEGEQSAKLLGIIPVEMKVRAVVNAETAKLEMVEKPWWSPLTIR